jgi:hypothetical protein
MVLRWLRVPSYSCLLQEGNSIGDRGAAMIFAAGLKVNITLLALHLVRLFQQHTSIDGLKWFRVGCEFV